MIRRAVPLYQQIAQHFESQIFAGSLPAGARIPSTTELAKTFKVNTETIQSALTLLTSRGLVERRRSAGTFVRPGASGTTVAVVFREANLSDPDLAFFNLLAGKLSQRLVRRGWRYRHYITTDDGVADQAFHELQRHVADGSVRAVVEFCSNPQVRNWVEGECPVPVARFPLGVDEDDMLRQGLVHVVGQGRRRIAVLHGHDPAGTAVAGLRQTAASVLAPLGCDPTSVDFIATVKTQAGGHAVAMHLADQGDGSAQAVIVLNDSCARGVLYGLMQRGLRVPEDVALITHANAGAEIFCHLPLTRLEVDPANMAERIIDELSSRIAGDPVDLAPMRAVLIPGRTCGEGTR